MDAFGYLSVLLSIIIGLAITQLLQGVRGIALARGTVRLYGPSLTWAALLLVVFVQTWWSMFGLRQHLTWTFPEFFVVILHSTTLYLLAALVFPDFHGEQPIDLRAHYFAQVRPFFGAAALATLISVAKDLVIDRRLPDPRNLAFHGAFLALALGAMSSRRESWHRGLALLGALTFGAYIVLLFSQLR